MALQPKEETMTNIEMQTMEAIIRIAKSLEEINASLKLIAEAELNDGIPL